MNDESDRQVIVFGQAARQLLDMPAYALILNQLSDGWLKTLVDTPPGAHTQSKRDHAHLMIHALREINDAVAHHANTLSVLEMRASRANEQED